MLKFSTRLNNIKEKLKIKFKSIKLNRSRSFYIVLIICVLALSVTTYVSYIHDRLTIFNQESESVREKVTVKDTQVHQGKELPQKQEVSQKPDQQEVNSVKEADKNTQQTLEINKNTSSVEKTSDKNNLKQKDAQKHETKPNLNTMIKPLFGQVIKPFSMDKLVYSKTLKQWETHGGIDIKAEQGTPVKAALPGKVEKISKDPRLGWKIVLNHGDGIKTVYANLKEKVMVKEGDYVDKGSVLGSVGKTALVEIADPPHLHFEVIKDNKSIDPQKFLPDWD